MTDMMRKQRTMDAAAIFIRRDSSRYGFDKAEVYFYNHHAAHGCRRISSPSFDDALIYTADGIGDNISYSVTTRAAATSRSCRAAMRHCCEKYKVNSVGLLYCYFTNALGFIWNRHEGKVTGLAGFGKPSPPPRSCAHFTVDADGEIYLAISRAIRRCINIAREVCARLSREDAAASVQDATEQIICDAIEKYLKAHRADSGCASAAASLPTCGSIAPCSKRHRRNRCSSIPPWATRDCPSAAACSICISATAPTPGKKTDPS